MTWTAWAVDCDPWKEEVIVLDSKSLESREMAEVLYCMYFILTPGVPLSIKHSEGFAGVGQTYRAHADK